MIERGWYDRSFFHDWSNGPFLVRTDTGRLITEQDLTNSGSKERYLAWDTAANSFVVYDPTIGCSHWKVSFRLPPCREQCDAARPSRSTLNYVVSTHPRWL